MTPQDLQAARDMPERKRRILVGLLFTQPTNPNAPGEWFAVDVMLRHGLTAQQMGALATKFSRKGWYDWGCNCSLGWLTPLGIEVATVIKEELPC